MPRQSKISTTKTVSLQPAKVVTLQPIPPLPENQKKILTLMATIYVNKIINHAGNSIHTHKH